MLIFLFRDKNGRKRRKREGEKAEKHVDTFFVLQARQMKAATPL
jgi:hypothetical protein